MSERRQKRHRVQKYIMDGACILEDCGYIAGDCIPIVPVYGYREFIDNQERFTGVVQDKMDAQRLYNAKVSKLAETDALAHREIPTIGRASCRERVCQYVSITVVAVSIKKNKARKTKFRDATKYRR